MNPLKDIDPKVAAEKVLEVGRSQAAKHFGVNESTFRDYLYRNDLPTKRAPKTGEKAGISIKDNQTAEITSEASPDSSDPEKLIIERGLDPAEWEFAGMTVNEWDGVSGETMRQLKVNIKRKNPIDFIEPARINGPKRRKPTKREKADNGKAVLIGDHHAPFYDEEMLESTLSLLADVKPKKGIHIGDLGDHPETSRHRHNPAWKASTQRSVNSSYDVLDALTNASPDTEWVLINGNHEDRLRNYMIDFAREIYGVTQAHGDMSVISIPHLLRLDELGVEFVGDEHTTYEYAKVKLNQNLAAVHGHLAVKDSGKTAYKLLDHYGHSVMCGHTHRQGHVFKTIRDIDDNPEILTAAEIGCACIIKEGIGYAPQSDWQQGLAVVDLFDNDLFNIDLATFIDGQLLYRGNSY
jgi:hypothetical protein